MKTTVVPAQVTTVEDKIMGGLGFSQLMLLVAPLFIGAGLYAVLPPFMSGSGYKYVLIVSLAGFCGLLALRIKGKIVAVWVVLVLSYRTRPRFYLFNKNTASGRDFVSSHAPASQSVPTTQMTTVEATEVIRLDLGQETRAMDVIADPAREFQFTTTKKGGLSVRLKQIKQEN